MPTTRSVILLVLIAIVASLAVPWLRGRYERQRVEAQAAARQKLDARVGRLIFNGVPLRRAVEKVQEVSGLPIEADWERLREQGADPDAPVNAGLDQSLLADVLNAILDVAAHNGRQNGTVRLGYAINANSVTLRPAQEIAAETSCLEVYDVTELLDLDKVAAPDVETIEWGIEEVMTTWVTADSWRSHGGFGDRRCRAGRLLILQTPERQAVVADRIRWLREELKPDREQVRLLRRLRGEAAR